MPHQQTNSHGYLKWGAVLTLIIAVATVANLRGQDVARLGHCETKIEGLAEDMKELRVLRIIQERIAAKLGVSTDVDFE